MLRFKVLVSVIPLIAAATVAHIEFFPTTHPCVAVASGTVEIASVHWHADLHVSFTDDPRLATVRVAISEGAEVADFAVVDDIEAVDDRACQASPATQFVAISAHRDGGMPVIYLSRDDGPADYRIFVHSKRFTDRQAAALIVGSQGQRHRQGPHLASAEL
jgi:hypothetical protein